MMKDAFAVRRPKRLYPTGSGTSNPTIPILFPVSFLGTDTPLCFQGLFPAQLPSRAQSWTSTDDVSMPKHSSTNEELGVIPAGAKKRIQPSLIGRLP